MILTTRPKRHANLLRFKRQAHRNLVSRALFLCWRINLALIPKFLNANFYFIAGLRAEKFNFQQ